MYQLSVEGWIYFGILTLILAFSSNYLSQKKDRNVGKIIFEMKVEKKKLLLIVLLIGVCVGFIAMLFFDSFNTNRLMRVLLAVTVILICIYNLAKKRIITELGLGYKNIFGKSSAASIIKWSSIKEWKWIQNKKVLLYDIDVDGTMMTQRWEVDPKHINDVDKSFKIFAKNKMK